jgi:hypothetical protein
VLVAVVVIVVVAAAAVVIMAMTVRVSVIMLMVVIMAVIVGVCMAVTMIILAVAMVVPMAASLAWRVIMSAIMLGLGCLLGRQQGGYSLTTVLIGLSGELVDRGQRLESHSLEVSSQRVSLTLSTWEFDKGATSLEWNASGAEQSSGSHQDCGLLAGDDVEFDAIHVEDL